MFCVFHAFQPPCYFVVEYVTLVFKCLGCLFQCFSVQEIARALFLVGLVVFVLFVWAWLLFVLAWWCWLVVCVVFCLG